MIAFNLLQQLMKRVSLAALILGSAVFAAPAAWGSFDDIGAGARSAGMADAQTALADDANAAVHNPAGLIQVGDPRISAEFADYARGLTDGSQLGSTYVGYAHPWKPGDLVLGFAYRDFKASDIVQERTMMLGAGKRLKIQPFGWDGVWSVGGNAKMLTREFATSAFATNAVNDSGAASGRADPLLSGGGKTNAFGVDLGVLYQFGRGLNSSFGVMAMNVNRPDISIESGDRAPEIIKIGVAHRPRWGAVTAEIRRAHRVAGEADSDMALGAERHFRLQGPHALSVRGGYAEGSRGFKAVTAGAAYHFGRFSLDYALSFPIGHLSDTDGHQRFGFSMRFGTGTAKISVPTVVSTPTATVSVVTSTPTPVAPVVPTPAPVVTPTPVVVPPVVETPAPVVPAPVATPVATPAPVAVPAPVETPVVAPVVETPAPVAPVVAPKPVETPKPVVAPKAAPLKAPAELPVAKPKPAATSATPTAPATGGKPVKNPAAERAWQFYEEAVTREVADHEKIELLESMLMRFGEGEAKRINLELEKLRKRAQKNGKGGKAH